MPFNQVQTVGDFDALQTYASSGGCDIIAVMNGVECGSLQAISVSVSREKMPLYVMGRADPVGYSRGKRGIAGSMVGVVFNQSWLMHTIKGNTDQSPAESGVVFWASNREFRQFRRIQGAVTSNNRFDESFRQISGNGTPVTFYTGRTRQEAWYSDQILPFNVVLTGANEYGGAIAKSIIGVEILNTATGSSVDDIMIDESHTYLAVGVTPWMSLGFVSPRSGRAVDESRTVDEILSRQGLSQAQAIFDNQ